MSLAEFDIGPLTWVKGEIDAALLRAKEQIALFAGNLADTSPLKFAQTHLHQVKGAIQMVGLDGLARFAEEVERHTQALEAHEIAATADTLDLLDEGLNAIAKYLDEVMATGVDTPLKLFPMYHKLLEARGVERVVESDLFYPDLSVRAPKGEAPGVPESDIARHVRGLRMQYQKGLLGYLRSQDAAGLRAMRDALAAIETTQGQPANRTFWWTTVAYLDGLLAGGLPANFNVKSLCGRIDQQIRRVVDGSSKVAEKLARDVLYHVATAKPATERLSAVQSAFELNTYLPQVAVGASDAELERAKPILRELVDLVAAGKEAWLKFTAGNKDMLKIFQDHAKRTLAKAETLGHEALTGLVEKISAGVDEIAAGGGAISESVSMEMATALMLAENAVGNFARLSDEFVRQADVQGRRLQKALLGESTEGIEEVPMLDEISRKAQEKLLLTQVATEIQTNLRHVEQVLDAFFRDHSKRADLPGLSSYIHQIFGALQILELERAADLLTACQQIINKFADPAYAPEARDMELVAEGLSSLGFYVEAVQHGRTDAFEIIAPVIKTFPGIANPVVRESDQQAPEAVEIVSPEVPVASIEAGIEDQKRSAQSLFAAWQADSSADNRDALQAQLTMLSQDADLIDDAALKTQAQKVMNAMQQAGDAPNDAVAQAMIELTTPKVAAVAPSAETARLLGASAEVIDRELLDTYLEEAQEVLATVREHLAIVTRRPHDREALTTIRRGFHTLKGSGRMVGLTDLGEVAWGIEQTMNKWLQDEKDATPELLSLIQHAHDAFAGWVDALNQQGTVEVEASALLAEAEALRKDPTGPFDLSAQREALLASRTAMAPQDDALADKSTVEPPNETVEPVAEEAEFIFDFGEAPVEESIEAAAAPEAAPTEATASDDIQIGDLTLSATLYALFLEEGGNHLATLLRHFEQMRQHPEAAPEHEFMRAAHTLAGISSTVGFMPVADLAHSLERWLLDVIEHRRTIPPAELAVVEEVIPTLQAMMQAVRERQSLVPATALDQALQQATGAALSARNETAEEIVAEPPEAPLPDETIEALIEEVPAAPEPEIEPEPPRAIAPAPASPPPAIPARSVAMTDMPRRSPAISLDSSIRDDLDEQLLPVFLEEAQELMPLIGTQLRAWRDAPVSDDASQALRRVLHTLKGSARMAGAMRMGELTHRMETTVLGATEGSAPDEALFDELDSYFDTINDLHEALIRGESAAAPATETALSAAVAPVVLGMQPAITLPQADMLAEMEQAAARAVLRVRADTIDRLVNEAGEVSIARSRIEGEMLSFKQSLKDLTENVIRLRNQLREIEIQAESQMQSQLSAAHDAHRDFDPLEFDRFTRLQEVTRMMAESVNDVSTVQQAMLKDLDEVEAALVAQGRLNRELQQGLMRIRMVPIASVTERLHRVVRQTAKDLGKKAALKIEGENVELDRSVLEKMTAPFEHLLRNAVAHGIEPEGDREVAGKPELGTIELKARQEGNEVVLTINDDGSGIDLDRVRAKAVELGFIAPTEEASAGRLMEMIFQPGFSTASEVTQVSGRGVGMDVVRNEIAGLGGRVEVNSEKGKGTHFTVYLPLTLAVTQVVMVRAGELLYALPSSMVEQVQELKPEPLAKVYQAGQVEWLGNTYPLQYLPRLLGNDEAVPEAKTYTSVMLLRSGTQRVAIHVDALEGNQEVVVKNIGPQLARVTGISGATVLGNGEIVLIINPVQLAHREAAHVGAMAPVPTPQEEVQVAPVIMVVDDSLTVRKITGRLLAKEGYQVVTAKDGVDALQQLQEVRPAVMLVDIEMPRMDGFELTKNVRGDPETANIPIIMITSRTAEKHRNYARELGVNVYLGKPYQEDELLTHIAHFVKQAVTA